MTERNEEGTTFAQELGFPEDREWMDLTTEDFRHFAESHDHVFGSFALHYLQEESCKDVKYAQLLRAISENNVHQPLFDLCVLFMHAGFIKGVQTGEERTARDAHLKSLLERSEDGGSESDKLPK